MARNVNATYPSILRATGDVQTDNGLLWTPPSWSNQVGAGARSAQNIGMMIRSFSLQNLAAAGPVGLGWRFVNYIWIAGRYDGTTYTDATSLYQARTSTAVQVVGADQTGFIILSRQKFGWVSANFDTAETNAAGVTTPDHLVKYSAAAGAFTTATAGLEDDFTQTDVVWPTGIKNFVWMPASDWVVTNTHTGLPAGYYAMYFTSAHREANDVAAKVTGIEIGGFGELLNSLAQNGIFEEDPVGPDTSYYTPWGNGLVAYFGTANAGNLVSAQVETA